MIFPTDTAKKTDKTSKNHKKINLLTKIKEIDLFIKKKYHIFAVFLKRTKNNLIFYLHKGGAHHFKNCNNKMVKDRIFTVEDLTSIFDEIEREKGYAWFQENEYVMFDKNAEITSEDLLKYGIRTKEVFPNFSNLEEYGYFLTNGCLDDINEVFEWGLKDGDKYTDEHINKLKFFKIYNHIVQDEFEVVIFKDFKSFVKGFEDFKDELNEMKEDGKSLFNVRRHFFFNNIKQYWIQFRYDTFFLLKRDHKTFSKNVLFEIGLNEDEEKFNEMINFVKTGLFKIID